MNLIIAGSCSTESRKQVIETTDFLYQQGVRDFRIAMKKYRSDPKTYQGTSEAVAWMEEIKNKYNDIKIYTEVFSEHDITVLEGVVDVYQVGSRNAHNVELLKILNTKHKPVLFKRHYAMSLAEFVKHSEYLDDVEVIMCLRGTMSLFPQEKRFQPDFDDIPRLKELTNNKVIYDVSHSAGRADLIAQSIMSANIFGADGLMIEVHPNPEEALSDPDQQIDFDAFRKIKENIAI